MLHSNIMIVDIKVTDNKDGTYTCKYTPSEPIKHTIIITFGGVNVPKSPFRVSFLNNTGVVHS